MNYQQKYLKYKNKYINLKKQTGGFNPLFNTNSGLLLNKQEYDKLNDTDKKQYDFYCPDNKPYLCTINSKSLGLCKKDQKDCNNIDEEGVQPIIVGQQSKAGEKHGYMTDYLHNRCFELYQDYIYENDEKTFLPDNFKIVTYNIWGIYRKKKPSESEHFNKYDELNSFTEETIRMRMDKIAEEILISDPDVVCFQEMSNITHALLSNKLDHIYKYKYEINFEKRQKIIEVHIFSKYPAKKAIIYGIKGNLNYRDSLMILEFNNVIIFNCYLQAGSKNSPGQEKYWYHYSRCREDQLNQIKKLIEEYLKIDCNIPIILLGDFNLHLDGPIEEWNELKVIKDYLQDSWKVVNKDDNGFTENTDINTMRWNLKFQEKKLRYDGILYKNLIPISSKIIGNMPIKLNERLTNLFKKYWIAPNSEDKIKYSSDGKTLELFPSDHFGVITNFSLNLYANSRPCHYPL